MSRNLQIVVQFISFALNAGAIDKLPVLQEWHDFFHILLGAFSAATGLVFQSYNTDGKSQTEAYVPAGPPA